jgi:hypothetical protein
MNVEQQSIRRRPRLEIDEKLGFILAVVAGALLSIAVGGWMILLSNITQLRVRSTPVKHTDTTWNNGGNDTNHSGENRFAHWHERKDTNA